MRILLMRISFSVIIALFNFERSISLLNPESSNTMMDRLREGANSIAIKVILGLIILSFVFAGIGSYLVSGSNNAAAKVGDSKISRTEFEQEYQNERNRMQSQLGDYFSNLLGDPAYVASFRKSVLDRMINNLLVEQQAEQLGLRVSDAQVREQLLAIPAFQKDGKFDQELYQSALRRVGFTPDSFAEYLRQDLVRNQLMSALQGSAFSLKGEVAQQAALINQTRDVRTITLKTVDFAKTVQLSDDEINQYYKEHPEAYTRPEQAKISYVELSAQALQSQIKVTDQEVQQYYKEHQDKYSTAEQRKVSHILIKDDEKKAEEVLSELKGGADFAALAKKDSQDVGSANEGGSLGWIEHDTMDPEFEKAAFALTKAGELSGVVKSAFGYHIIKLDEVKPGKVKPLKEVAAQIRTELVSQKAIDQFYDLQSKLEKVAFESPDSLDEAAKTIGAKVVTTDFVSAQDAPKLLQNADVQKALETPEVKEDGLNSEVVEVAPEHVVVVRVEESRPEQVLPLAQVKEQVVKQLTDVKAKDTAASLGDKLVAALAKGDDSVLKANKLKFGDVETIDRNSPLAEAVFAMPKPEADKATYSRSSDAEQNVVVVKLEKVATNNDGKYQQQIGQQLTQISVQQDMAGILAILRANTDIEYYVK